MASSPALESFMKNNLQVRKYQIQIVADNAKLPQVNSEHSLVQEYLSPASRKRKILALPLQDRWDDLVDEQDQEYLSPDSRKRKSLARPLQDRWDDLVDEQDYRLSSVAIGRGAVAMKPQDSLNRYLLETDLEETAATTIVTLPEDESVHTYDDKATSRRKHKKKKKKKKAKDRKSSAARAAVQLQPTIRKNKI
jgi:hypothetical protein